MPKVCLYLQLHQPYRLQPFTVFDLGAKVDYFSQLKSDTNRDIFKKVAHKSYIPMLRNLRENLKLHEAFRFSLSCSGVFLEQAQAYAPEVITLLKELATDKRVEFLAETYHHSLAALYSPSEFVKQVTAHRRIVAQLFHRRPKVFRNTELIYSNAIAQLVGKLGFAGMLTEGVDRYLKGRSRTQVYRSNSRPAIPLLLKHAKLSDDIAFRFADRNWDEYPLTVEKYLSWMSHYATQAQINLFMDFETFGEHNWEDTGVFTFFDAFVTQFLSQPANRFVTPSDVLASLRKNQSNMQHLPKYDVPVPISWADVDRDLTAWIDNPLQKDMLQQLYVLEKEVVSSKNATLISDWRRLQTSDHFYYMCTKWSADGDVHAYFNPYSDPYEAYRRYATVLADIRQRLL